MTVPQISLEEAWERLSGDRRAVLIDVRTQAEWSFVGTPDLSSIESELRLVEWTRYPTGEPNPNFVDQATRGLEPNQPVLLLCRSGARSNAAAAQLAAQGYDAANVGAGFEGDVGPDGHRHGGWKESLPWVQK